MNNMINKLSSTISNIVLFLVACVMAGIGFVFIGTIAVFALFTAGILLVASPFVSAARDTEETQDAVV